MPHSSQIFQTGSATRWQRFKWALRILLVVAVLAIIAVAITIYSANLPSIPLESRAMKKVLNGEMPDYRQSKLGKEYRGFRKYIDDRWSKGRGCGQNNNVPNLSNSALFNDSIGIRAAFYDAWDPQSFLSLKRNIGNLNLVLPEWLFIDPKGDSLVNNIDKRAFDIIKEAKVKAMPQLSYNPTNDVENKAFHRILTDTIKQNRLINDIQKLLTKYKFAGINIDFEEVHEKNETLLFNFQKRLYNALHTKNLLVTQCVSPYDNVGKYKGLNAYNDYIFLMTKDEHDEYTKPGPISGQKWIESSVNKLASQVSPSKIILILAGYGYDWQLGGKPEMITYQQALVTARESSAEVVFDNDSYNLNYKYYDGNDTLHEVHFTDAATNFNSLRFATEYGLAGTALFRLGSEDVRLWDFYNRPMTKASLKTFNFKEFDIVDAYDDVDYIGQGEILDVLATPANGHITSEIDSTNFLISEETYDVLPSAYVVKKWGKTSEKKLVLTYDDGPDPLYTRQILDTLAYYHVPAAFFLVGIAAETNIPLVKRIIREGHEIGNHTFTHPDVSKISKNRALLEMDATRLLIECITGHSTIMFRAPFNADYEPEKAEEIIPVALSRTRNYITIGESIDPEDWEKGIRPGLNADTIFNRVVQDYERHLRDGDSCNIILLHDAGGDRSETVKATGKIIRYYQAKGYQFVTIANLLHKKEDDLMPPIDKTKDYYLIQINYLIAEAGYLSSSFFYALFLLFMGLSALRIMALGVMAVLQKRKENRFVPIVPQSYPLVSIIVPAYNEEVNVLSSLANLLKCDYPNFNIIFVDDGSKDNTWQQVSSVYTNHPIVKAFTKPNGGKASALNYGIGITEAEFVVCIDADTKLSTNAVSKLMQNFFANPNVGAVAGVVKVGNEVNMLTRWQNIEYITSQNFDRKGFAYANAITVVPGAIGGFRKVALQDAGGFTTDTLAEDCDITIRILKAGYIIANEPHAIAYTEAPESLKQFMKQRFRWSFGVMQTFYKQRDTLFNKNYGSLGFVAMPDILLFKYIIPFFTPIADMLMIAGLFTENAGKVGFYYLIFTLIDALISAISFLFERENPLKLLWLIPQRIVYRWLMMVVLFRAFKKAIKGELQHWGVLKRTGNVKDIANS